MEGGEWRVEGEELRVGAWRRASGGAGDGNSPDALFWWERNFNHGATMAGAGESRERTRENGHAQFQFVQVRLNLV